MTAARNQELGRAGEAAAAAWYQSAGFELLDRNWRIRRGEIDLIVAKDDIVVFSEVKTRSSGRFGRGVEAVTWRKQQTIRGVAVAWLAQSPRHFGELRFDVVDVNAQGHVQVWEGCF